MTALMRRRGMMQKAEKSILPSGYKQVASILIGKNAHINTGLSPTSKDVIRFTAKASLTGSGVFLGFHSVGLGYVASYTSYNDYLIHWASGIFFNTGVAKTEEYHNFTIDVPKLTWKIDGNSGSGGIGNRYYAGDIVSIGGRLKGSTLEVPLEMYLRNYETERDGVLICKMVPCRRISDGSYGVYDIVRNSFFGNSGSDSITDGGD